MRELTKDGYNRKMAPDLLDLAKQSRAEVDKVLKRRVPSRKPYRDPGGRKKPPRNKHKDDRSK